LIEPELRTGPDPKRSSNENVRALPAGWEFWMPSDGSKSKIHTANADVTASAATANTALPNHTMPRREDGPAEFVEM
jgi:hypothetical protein